MSKPENGPLQGRFDVSVGALQIDQPFHVSKKGEPVKLMTGNIKEDIVYEHGLIRELFRRLDAGDKSPGLEREIAEVTDSVKRKLALSEDFRY